MNRLISSSSARLWLGIALGASANGQVSFQWLDGMHSASGVSANGAVVAGTANGGWFWNGTPARWTSSGITLIPQIPGVNSINYAYVSGISADGSTIIGGNSYGVGAINARTQAFRWTDSTGTTGLGSLPGKVSSRASAVSADGSVIVGQSESVLPGGLYSPPEAYRWTTGGGMVSGLSKAWLIDRGLNPPLIPPDGEPPFQAVPEPSTYGAFAALLVVAVIGRRLKRRQSA